MTEPLRTGAWADSTLDEENRRAVGWFHELDAWTEYWDVYHPETRGRFYFGDGQSESGLLRLLLPRETRPPVFQAWVHAALSFEDGPERFARAVTAPGVAAAVMEVDALLERLFSTHFGDATDARVQADYLRGIMRFAMDTLPAANERAARLAEDDPRKATAARHTLDGDLMWFGWALELEAAFAIVGADRGHARRSLLLAGVAVGCPANFSWRGHRRTRAEYRADDATAALLLERGMRWASDFKGAADEMHALYRIREWGHED